MVHLAERLRAALTEPLPGLDAQLRLAPSPRLGWDPHTIPAGLRPAAGLVLLYRAVEEPHVLLTVRGGSLRHHTGQVSLPGGALDEGETIEFECVATAAADGRCAARSAADFCAIVEAAGEPAAGANRRRSGHDGSVCREPRVGNLSSGKLSLGKPDHNQKSCRLRNLLGSNSARLQALPNLFTVNQPQKGT